MLTKPLVGLGCLLIALCFQSCGERQQPSLISEGIRPESSPALGLGVESVKTGIEMPAPDELTPNGSSTLAPPTNTNIPDSHDIPMPHICSSQVDTRLPQPGFEISRYLSDVDRSTRDTVATYAGPLIDAHVHLDPPRDATDPGLYRLQTIVNALQGNGVEMAVFMPTPNDGRFPGHVLGASQRITLKKIAPDNIRLFAGSNYISYWLHQACRNQIEPGELQDVLVQLSTDLLSEEYIGVGELGVLHFIKRPNQKLIAFQPNFDPFLDIVQEISAHDVWLDLHMEPIDPNGVSYEDWFFGGLQLLFDQNPRLKVILSHTAMTNPVNARNILESYPNVMLSIKPMTPTEAWRNLEPVLNHSGEVYEDWAKLFEAMPDRCIIGSDAKFGRRGFTPETYGRVTSLVR